jgi:hypothetical protein
MKRPPFSSAKPKRKVPASINCEERLQILHRVRIPYGNQTSWTTNLYVALLMIKRCYKFIISSLRLMSGVHLMISVQLP